MARLVLVTGGARSGKSRWAEQRVLADGGSPSYLASCRVEDAEMQQRVARHRADRADRGWRTIEEPLAVPAALRHAPAGPVLVDCLTLWLSNLLLDAHQQDSELDEDAAAAHGRELLAAAATRDGLVVVVTNEVGAGLVPMDPLSRRFRDCAGRLNHTIAHAADELLLLVCGQPLVVKGPR